MQPTTALSRMAAIVNASAVIGTADGTIKAAHYPHVAVPNQLPCLVLFWDETAIEYGGDFQLWHMTVRGQLLTAALGEPPVSVPRIDPVIAKLADLFAASLNPGNYHLEAAGSTDRAEHCALTRVQPSAAIAYASEAPNFYGAELFWTVKVPRFAGES
jgi:hypothetical protein